MSSIVPTVIRRDFNVPTVRLAQAALCPDCESIFTGRDGDSCPDCGSRASMSLLSLWAIKKKGASDGKPSRKRA